MDAVSAGSAAICLQAGACGFRCRGRDAATALRLWEKFNEYDGDRPFVAWAIGFAYHEVLSWRQDKPAVDSCFRNRFSHKLHTTIGEEASMLELRRKALDGCLQKVDAQERELLLRRYSEHGAVQREAGESKRVHTTVLRHRKAACSFDGVH